MNVTTNKYLADEHGNTRILHINNLIVCEIPKGAKYMVRDKELVTFSGGKFKVVGLPELCEFIGLSGATDSEQTKHILDCGGVDYWFPSVAFREFLATHSLDNPASDYLFLKIIK